MKERVHHKWKPLRFIEPEYRCVSAVEDPPVQRKWKSGAKRRVSFLT